MEDRQALIVPEWVLLYHLYGSRRPPSRINPGETVDIAVVHRSPRIAVRGLGPTDELPRHASGQRRPREPAHGGPPHCRGVALGAACHRRLPGDAAAPL